jgi:hypothetical protein
MGQMLFISGRLPTIDWTYDSVQSGASASYTFTVNIGAEAPSRLCVFGVDAVGFPISSVTVNGVAATSLIGVGTNTRLIAVPIPTGTTASVVVNLTGAAGTTASVSAWAIKGLRSQTAVASASSLLSPSTFSLSVPSNGVAIGYATNVAATTFTWTGIASDFASTTSVIRGGAHTVRTAANPLAFSVAYSAASSPHALAATWR